MFQIIFSKYPQSAVTSICVPIFQDVLYSLAPSWLSRIPPLTLYCLFRIPFLTSSVSQNWLPPADVKSRLLMPYVTPSVAPNWLTPALEFTGNQVLSTNLLEKYSYHFSHLCTQIDYSCGCYSHVTLFVNLTYLLMRSAQWSHIYKLHSTYIWLFLPYLTYKL